MANGSGDKKTDTTSTYVLEETAITKVTSIEELAELAAGQTKPRPDEKTDSEGDDGTSAKPSRR